MNEENPHIPDQKNLVRLIDRLNSYPIGLPDSPEIREFLTIFLDDDEIELAANFPMKEVTAEELAKKVDWPLDKVSVLLEKMANKGTVIDFVLNERSTFWMLSPSIIGFIEFSLMKIHDDKPMKKMAELLHKYEHSKLFTEVFGSKTRLTRVLVEHDVPISSEIMTHAQVAEVIKNAGGGSIQKCFCRHQAELIGKPCKIADHEGTCITLGKASNFVVRRGFAKSATVEELLKLTKELGKKGLMHITDNIRDKPTFICNCCGCCCGLLSGILEKNIPHAVSPSPFILNINKENCSGCGACVKMCQIKALSLKDQKAEVDDRNCLGCGSCIKFCKKNALSLIKRRKQPKMPRNMSERFLKIAWEKKRLHKLFPSMLFSKLSKLV